MENFAVIFSMKMKYHIIFVICKGSCYAQVPVVLSIVVHRMKGRNETSIVYIPINLSLHNRKPNKTGEKIAQSCEYGSYRIWWRNTQI